MESSRKKVLEMMQKAMVTYKLINDGWQVGHQIGSGYDVVAIKEEHVAKIELKAIDLAAIAKGKGATQHLTANEIVHASHLIISIYDQISLKANLIMTMRQFVEDSGVKKYRDYPSYDAFHRDYVKLARQKSAQRKGMPRLKRLDFDFSFNPKKIDDWKLIKYHNQWENIASHYS